MKVGFGGKKKQKKQKKKQKKDPKKGQQDGDDVMADAAPASEDLSHEPEAIEAEQQEGTAEASAKDKQRQRMELKKQLKVQVASLKSKRNKLTKLAGNKTERRQLNTQLRGLMQEQVLAGKSEGSKGSKGSKQKHKQAKEAQDGMTD